MRSIFARLLLSFFLTVLLSSLISALVFYSFSRRSMESFRDDFRRRLHANITRSTVLMGQAAYMMYQHRGQEAFERYIREVETSMHTRIFLAIDGTVVPENHWPDHDITELAATATGDHRPVITDLGDELVVVQRFTANESTPYVIIGLHKLGQPPGMNRPRPPPPRTLTGEQKFPPPPHPGRFSAFFFSNRPEFQTGIFLLIAGIVSYLLARSFSAPLNKLRKASRQIADGDLSARVGTSLGKQGNEIGDLGRDFDNMAERMEGLVNAQKRLLLDISHELRSPLTRLNLALELASKRHPDQDPHLERIAKESERLNVLIGQLLALTRNERFLHASETTRVALAPLVREITDDVTFEIGALDRAVRLTAVAEVSVIGNRELLHQAFENIVRNAAYYTHPGTEVTISLARREIQQHPYAIFQVRDHGPGVPMEMLPHLVEPFFRVAEARDRRSGGTGLGLAITNRVVQQHNGQLHLQNGPERDGLLVEIRLPLAAD